MESFISDEDFDSMKLHETKKINKDCSVMKVVGGWNYIYNIFGNTSVVYVEIPGLDSKITVTLDDDTLQAIKMIG